MKKILAFLLTFFAISFTIIPHPAKPVFDEGTAVKYVTYEDKGLPFELTFGKSKGQDLMYIKGYGRVFLVKTEDGYKSTTNNFYVKLLDNGHINISGNVTMADLNAPYPEKYKKGEFFHSLNGYLHSHVYPKLDKNIIKVSNDEFEVIEKVDEFSKAKLYEEKNGKFSFLLLNLSRKAWEKVPQLAEFRFSAELEPVK